MNGNIFLITGLSVLGLGFSTLLAQTTTGVIHMSAAGQIVTPVPTPRPHHHHHRAALMTSATAQSGLSNTTSVGMAAFTATPTSASGNSLKAPIGVPTSIPVATSVPLKS